MPNIKAITLDFWVARFRDADGDRRLARRARDCASAFQISEAAAATALQEVAAEFHRSHSEDQRTLTPSDAVQLLCRRFEKTLNAEAAADLTDGFGTAIIRHSPVSIDGALAAVQYAAARLPLALISDSGISPGASLRQLLDRHGFTEHFAALVFSDEVGVAKPQGEMFATAAKGLNVPAHTLLHIGDLEPTDIAGIHAAGGCGILFAGANDRFREQTTAEHILDSWWDFPRLLDDLLAAEA